MWLNEDAPIHKRDLFFSKPFVNSAGTLGFAPDPHKMPIISNLGAFITHPISRKPRQPAFNRACIPNPGGFLLHTGLPNPGIIRSITRYKRAWAGAALPIIVHLLVENPKSLTEMIHKLEGLENVMAVELGLPPNCDPDTLHALMDAAVGELPVIPCVSPDQIPVLRETLIELNPTAVHLVEPRGTLPNAAGDLVTGRLYGPGTFPTMLHASREFLDAGFLLIVNGGMNSKLQTDTFLSAGITALGLGSALWGLKHEFLA
jgi:dihydroorotate dehydrogenase (NAD+) catalytic subunit